MEKRHFLGTVAAAGALPLLAGAAGPAAHERLPHAPALLTVTGAIGRGNRGRFNPAFDQMMHKHRVSFSKAWAFDFATLAALPWVAIRPTLEYDSKAHTLSGPRLLDVVAAAGATASMGMLVLRAVDGYAVSITQAQARTQGFIVATHLDGQPMALGGLGPLWAVYDADQVPQMAARPLAERFGACPWALYHIDVQA
jgi:hypothetical protein